MSEDLEVTPSPEPAAAPEPKAHPVLAEVEAWFVDHFHGLGPRLEAELFNEFHKAKEELKVRLQHLL